jgi:hypothetical protein
MPEEKSVGEKSERPAALECLHAQRGEARRCRSDTHEVAPNKKPSKKLSQTEVADYRIDGGILALLFLINAHKKGVKLIDD